MTAVDPSSISPTTSELPRSDAPVAAVDPTRWASSLVDLAVTLGVDRRTLNNWKHRPGCPVARENGRYLVEEWIAFARSLGGTSAVSQSEDKAALQARELEIDCRRKEFDFAIKRGLYATWAEVDTAVAQTWHAVRLTLYHVFEHEMADRFTLDPARNRQLAREALDRALGQLSEPMPFQTQRKETDNDE
ncbi:MAG: hypothetical protein INR62_03220 [Rhodospirillales bacterium]|nr:hypothetical protein [Acetobacter sp.]